MPCFPHAEASAASASRNRCASARSAGTGEWRLLSALIELVATTRRSPGTGLRSSHAASASSGPKLAMASTSATSNGGRAGNSPRSQVTPPLPPTCARRETASTRAPRSASIGSRKNPIWLLAPKTSTGPKALSPVMAGDRAAARDACTSYPDPVSSALHGLHGMSASPCLDPVSSAIHGLHGMSASPCLDPVSSALHGLHGMSASPCLDPVSSAIHGLHGMSASPCLDPVSSAIHGLHGMSAFPCLDPVSSAIHGLHGMSASPCLDPVSSAIHGLHGMSAFPCLDPVSSAIHGLH